MSSVNGPGSPAGSPASSERVALAVSARAALVLCGPLDQGISNGGEGSGAAGWLITIAASSRLFSV